MEPVRAQSVASGQEERAGLAAHVDPHQMLGLCGRESSTLHGLHDAGVQRDDVAKGAGKREHRPHLGKAAHDDGDSQVVQCRQQRAGVPVESSQRRPAHDVVGPDHEKRAVGAADERDLFVQHVTGPCAGSGVPDHVNRTAQLLGEPTGDLHGEDAVDVVGADATHPGVAERGEAARPGRPGRRATGPVRASLPWSHDQVEVGCRRAAVGVAAAGPDRLRQEDRDGQKGERGAATGRRDPGWSAGWSAGQCAGRCAGWSAGSPLGPAFEPSAGASKGDHRRRAFAALAAARGSRIPR